MPWHWFSDWGITWQATTGNWPGAAKAGCVNSCCHIACALKRRGGSLLLFNGVRVKGRWWQDRPWALLQSQVCRLDLLELLAVIRNLLLAVQEQLTAATTWLQSAATPQVSGVGALTSQILEREILGLAPGLKPTASGQPDGYVPWRTCQRIKNPQWPDHCKHGNRRLRTALVELAWRCVRFQPGYPPLKKMATGATQPQGHRSGQEESHRSGGAAGWPLTCGGAQHRPVHRRQTRTQINQCRELKPFWERRAPGPGLGSASLNPQIRLGAPRSASLDFESSPGTETVSRADSRLEQRKQKAATTKRKRSQIKQKTNF